MTAAEAFRRINAELSYYGAGPEELPKVLEWLNSENEAVNRDLNMPYRYHTGQETDEAFTPYDDMLTTGLEKAWLEQDTSVSYYTDSEDADTYEIPIVTVQQANEKYPGWDYAAPTGATQFGVRLIVYDPRNEDTPFYPVGFSSGETIRLKYVIKVDPISSKDDELLNGYLGEFHDIIWLRVVWKRLNYYKNIPSVPGVTPEIAIMYYGKIQSREEICFNKVNDDIQ